MFKYFNYKPIEIRRNKETFDTLKLIVNQIVDYDMCIYNFKEYNSLAIEKMLRSDNNG